MEKMSVFIPHIHEDTIRVEGLFRVSIGMPVYNGEEFIRRALDSLLSQTFSRFELIISDNASTDNTWKILQEYAVKDKRIILHRQTNNIGIFKNFIFILNQAKGKYFMWTAADDYWRPGCISALVEELERHPESGVAMCAVDRIREDGTLLDTIRFQGKDNPNGQNHYQLFRNSIIIKFNFYIYGLFRTPFLKKTFSSCPIVPLADRLFICQIALATRFRYVDKVLYIKMVIKHNLIEDYIEYKGFHNKLVTYFKVLYAMTKMICTSDIIPLHRKFYLPIGIERYSRIIILSWVSKKIQGTLNQYKKAAKEKFKKNNLSKIEGVKYRVRKRIRKSILENWKLLRNKLRSF